MKILILKPSSLGDVVQALPVLRLLKRHRPGSQIYWWIETALAPLLEGDPDLAGILRFERRRWTSPKNLRWLWHSLLWARAQRFDLIIDLQSLARSGAFAWLSNGQLTVGLDDPREGAPGYFDRIVPRPSFTTHAVDWYLSVLRALEVPVDLDFEWFPQRPGIARNLLEKWPLAGKRWVILQPGARWLNKRWPLESFAELMNSLSAMVEDVNFAVLGGGEDAALGASLVQALPERCLDLTGRLSLPEMVECIRFSELMVANDTGPMHVAAGLRKPVIAVFGPTEPRRTGPYGQMHNTLQLALPCVPCLKSVCVHSEPFECLRALPPSAVLQRVKLILERTDKKVPLMAQGDLTPNSSG